MDSVECINVWIKNIVLKPKIFQFFPQYKFVFDERDQQVIDNIIIFDNIVESFNELTKVSELPPP